MVASSLGKNAERFMPWVHEPEPVSDAEIAQAHAELMEEIRFST